MRSNIVTRPIRTRTARVDNLPIRQQSSHAGEKIVLIADDVMLHKSPWTLFPQTIILLSDLVVIMLQKINSTRGCNTCRRGLYWSKIDVLCPPSRMCITHVCSNDTTILECDVTMQWPPLKRVKGLSWPTSHLESIITEHSRSIIFAYHLSLFADHHNADTSLY